MINNFAQISCNQFGNYVCQRLIEVCSLFELKNLVYTLLPFMIEMSFNQHGTRAVQILVETLATHFMEHRTFEKELDVIINELEKQVLLLCTHNHGNHVI